jgi:hypothetical protein
MEHETGLELLGSFASSPPRWQGDAGADFIEEFRLKRSYRAVSVNSGGRPPEPAPTLLNVAVSMTALIGPNRGVPCRRRFSLVRSTQRGLRGFESSNPKSDEIVSPLRNAGQGSDPSIFKRFMLNRQSADGKNNDDR